MRNIRFTTAVPLAPPPPRAALPQTDARFDDKNPVLRPQLPDAESLLPYLRRIDSARIYTNHGPLAAELESRLAERLALPTSGVACAASGTAALVGAILAVAGRASRERPFAVMPAFTFVATAVAAELCGYRPYLVDIDPESLLIDPQDLLDHPVLDHAGLVIPVAAFGRPPQQQGWRSFQERTTIPVVIDGAASFDRLEEAPPHGLGSIPVVLSFHATKAFGVGEGGGVAASDARLIERIVQALNFGFAIPAIPARPARTAR